MLLGAALTIGGYLFFTKTKYGDDSVRVSFTEAEVQKRIAKKFPIEEKVLDYIPVKIHEPTIKFLGDSKRVKVDVKASLDLPLLKTETLDGSFTGSIAYEKEDKTLRLSNLTVEQIATHRLKGRYQEATRLALTAAARKYLDDYILYTIEPKDLPRKAAELFVQKINVKDGRIEVVLGL